MTPWSARSVVRAALLFAGLFGGPALGSATAATVPGDYPTIQAAINAVLGGALPDGATIDVQPGTYLEILSVGNSSRSMTIRGIGGAAVTVVDAVGKGSAALNVFRASGRVSFIGLTFRHGAPASTAGGGFVIQDASPAFVDSIFELNTAADGAGGALINSSATFAGCTIRNNVAQRSGGGVLIINGSRPLFTRTDIVGNASGTGGSGIGNFGVGGGVYSWDSSPTFRGTRISANSSKFAAGGIYHMGVFGSANGVAGLLVEDSEIADNASFQFSAAENPAEGGGMHVEDNAVATLIRVRVLRNRADTGGGLNAYRARYDVFDSVIDGNQAANGFGGGIAATSNSPAPSPVRPASNINLTQVLVRNNTASYAGGGITVVGDNFCGGSSPTCTSIKASLSITQSVIDSNTAPSQGGGILLDRTDMVVSNSIIMRNHVTTNPSLAFGGGIAISTVSSAVVSGTAISANRSEQYGGGIFMDSSAAIYMSSSQLYDNTSAVIGGGLFVGGAGVSAGTIQDSTIADNSDSQIREQVCSATSITYRNNTVVARAGGNLYSGCAGTQTTIGGFNSGLSGRSSGNNGNVPRFAKFLAVPTVAGPSTLAWSVARATSVTVSGGVGTTTAATGAADVAPGGTTAFSLSASTASGAVGPATATVTVATGWGGANDVPVPADYDGDGKADIAVYRATGEWFILLSSNRTLMRATWGAPGLGDVPVSGDFDGDGKADIAVYRHSTGQWLVFRSSTSTLLAAAWGSDALGDVPVAGDFDGDGKTDFAVYRYTTGEWFVHRSSNDTLYQVSWGAPSLGDVPVAGDYDGDGKDDIAIYRGSTGQWFILRSSTGSLLQYSWGDASQGDVPVPADYDGDGKTDVAVARAVNGQWFVNRSTLGGLVARPGFGDVRVPADYDGNGSSNIAIWRSATGSWLIP